MTQANLIVNELLTTTGVIQYLTRVLYFYTIIKDQAYMSSIYETLKILNVLCRKSVTRCE